MIEVQLEILLLIPAGILFCVIIIHFVLKKRGTKTITPDLVFFALIVSGTIATIIDVELVGFPFGERMFVVNLILDIFGTMANAIAGAYACRELNKRQLEEERDEMEPRVDAD